MATAFHARVLLALLLAWAPAALASAAPAEPPNAPARPGLEFISTAFENASPLYWDIDGDGAVHVYLMYDHERSSPNRAAGHWHFQVQAAKGAELTLVLHNFDNVWNGKKGSPVSDKSLAYLSHDGRKWTAVPTEKLEGNVIRFRVTLDGTPLYVARLEPYRLSDLERLMAEIRGHALVEIAPIGRTVEGRPLEIIRIGRPDAPHRVLLRARAHAWEPGGNWVVQGLIRGLLVDSAENRRYLGSYCVYVMPMANKDGVARGWTRFNVMGKDLNRDWDRPADPQLAPENRALEAWIESMAAKGQRPDLVMDLHNDEGGKLHVSRPPTDSPRHLARMQRLEELLRRHTWFTEGSTGANFRNPGSLGEGLLERYGIDACVLELNCNWIAGLKQCPSGEAWEKFGRDLREVFFEYFQEP